MNRGIGGLNPQLPVNSNPGGVVDLHSSGMMFVDFRGVISTFSWGAKIFLNFSMPPDY